MHTPVSMGLMDGDRAWGARWWGWRVPSALLAFASLALGGCGLGGPAVPDEVERLVDAEFPADGQIHVLKAQGKFTIDLTTEFCTFPDSFGVSNDAWNKLFVERGISTMNNAGSTGRSNGPVGGCSAKMPPGTIQDKGFQMPNRNGEPYRLVLAVWQGDPARGGALWVGGVERLDGKRPDIARVPVHSGGLIGGTSRKKELQYSSINTDKGALSFIFIQHMDGR